MRTELWSDQDKLAYLESLDDSLMHSLSLRFVAFGISKARDAEIPAIDSTLGQVREFRMALDKEYRDLFRPCRRTSHHLRDKHP